MTARLILDMSADAYHADPSNTPSLSASIAHALVSRSPYHAWLAHPKLGAKGKRPTKEMDLGTAVHAMMLGAGKGIVSVGADNWREKAAREARDEARAAGKVAMLEREHAAARELATFADVRLNGFGIRLNGASEVVAMWTEQAHERGAAPWGNDLFTVTNCRGMLDHWHEQSATIYDIKTARSAHPRACASHIVEYGCDIQAAAYTRAIEAVYPELAGRVRFVFLFVESDTGVVTPVKLDGSLRHRGESRWQRAVNTWAECTRTGAWPGYVREVTMVEAPAWAMAEE